MGKSCGIYGGVRKYGVAIIRLAQRIPHGKTRDRWENKSPEETEEIRYKFVEWTDLAEHTEI